MNAKYLLLTGCLLLATHFANCQDAPPAAAPAHATVGGFSGKVVETTNTAGYTYLLVDTGSKKLWAAAPQFKVQVGETVTVAQEMAMPNYHSKSLNRDFEVVYFSGSVTVSGASPGVGRAQAKLPPNHPLLADSAKQPKPALVDLAGLKRAEGGRTVQEIIADKGKLKGKTVTVRGKVVKYNPMIMGKNWLHLQDGTGSAGNNDLMVTTAAEVKVGDTVLVTGSVSTDKDFGAGYKYDVMIDNAKVVAE